MNEDEIVARFWERHRRWSILADRLKSGIVASRSVVLGLSMAGALFQTLSASSLAPSPMKKVIAVAGAIALALVPILAVRFLRPEQVRQWLRARSVSEGLKSEIYRFRASASPYEEVAVRAAKLEENCKAIQVWFNELAVELAAVNVDDKPPPGPLDPVGYIATRVTQQIDRYYHPRAQKNAARAKLFRWLEIGMALGAAGLGAVATAMQLSADSTSKGGIGAWVAVLTTIGGGLVAHAAASRYDLQARSFFATKQQLEDLRGDWTRKGNPSDAKAWSDLVNACEECISAENRGWMAKLDPEEKTSAPGTVKL